MRVGGHTERLTVPSVGLSPQPVWLAMIGGIAMAGLFGYAIGKLSFRVRGAYFVIVSISFAEVVRLVASNEIWLTRGTDGISGIPGPWKRELGPDFNGVYFLIVLAVVLVANSYDLPPRVAERNGFTLAEWRHAGFVLHAVSDVAPTEMASFAAALDRATGEDR